HREMASISVRNIESWNTKGRNQTERADSYAAHPPIGSRQKFPRNSSPCHRARRSTRDRSVPRALGHLLRTDRRPVATTLSADGQPDSPGRSKDLRRLARPDLRETTFRGRTSHL